MFQKPTPIVLNLIIINVIVFFIGDKLSTSNSILALHYVGSGAFNPIQFFTYMFVHGDGGHIFGNMFGLFIFGPMLERYWGPKKFLLYYIICGLGAGVLYSGYVYYDLYEIGRAMEAYMANPGVEQLADFLHKHNKEAFEGYYDFLQSYAQHPNDTKSLQIGTQIVKAVYNNKFNGSMVGASGALYGVLLGVGMLFPFMEVYLLFPPIPLKMFIIVSLYGLMAIYGMVQQSPGDNVAHFAHVSGMLVGFILLKIWGERRANYY